MSDFYFIVFLLLTVVAFTKVTCWLYSLGVSRRKITTLTSVFFFMVSISPIRTLATHIAGSEITYRWVSGNTFELKLKLYRDCSGINAPTSVSVNYKSVSCGFNRNVTLTPIPGTGQEITHACSTAATTCSGGTNPGIQEYIYKGLVTLPAQCTDWVFSYGLCCRNCAITTLVYTPPNCNGIPSMYVEARLNNLAAPTNSSPEFTNIPITFVCIGQPFNYNHGAIDPDGDSLVYSFITPRDNAITNVTYAAGHSASQPVLSSPPVSINPAFGDITMFPTAVEVSVMAVLVREYRNGVLIGSIIRDMQIWTQPCSNLLPTATGINGTTNFDLVVCAGTPINFNINSLDPNTGQIVTMSWNFGITGATFTSTGSPYPTGTFSWTPTLADVRIQPYTFTVIVQDNNCPSIGFQIYSYSIRVTNVTASVTATNVLCSGTNSGTAVAVPSGGTLPYSYLWSPGGLTTQSISGLAAGSYSVVITDSNGCRVNATTAVASQPPLLANVSASANVSCNGGSNGTATVSVSGGTAPYSYAWSPSGGSAAVASGLVAGNYTITVTDANNCIHTSSVAVLQPAALAALVVSSPVSCFGGSNGTATVAVTGGTSPYTYTWSPSGATTAAATGLSVGANAVLITDAHGCITLNNITIVQPTALSLSTTTNPATCGSANGSATALISGGTPPYNFLWTPNAATTASVSGLLAGAYSVRVIDAHGCIVNASSAISNLGGPTASISSISPVSCFGGSNGSATVTVSGGTAPFTYTWFPGGNNTPGITGLSAGNYTVTIRDGNNCSTSISANIIQPPRLQLNPSFTNLSCFGSHNGSASVAVSGGVGSYSYTWAPGGGNSPSITNLNAGNYSVTVRDINNCSLSASVNVAQPAALIATIPSLSNVSCAGNNNGSATVSVSGGTSPYSYSWSPTGGAAAAASGLASGSYTVTVTDAHNCVQTAAVTILQPALLNAVPVASNVLCYGGNTGSASVTASGGTSPYSYAWSPSGGTGAIASGLVAGNYSVTVTDAHNCTQSASVAINQPSSLNSQIPVSNNVSCFGGSNGSATVYATGGTSPYTYLWSPGGRTSQAATGLAAGNYTVTIRDANNCTDVSAVTIIQPPQLAASIPFSSNVSCFGGNNGSATVSVSGGTAPYAFAWSSSAGTADTATGLTNGNYSVVVTDAVGCVTIANVSISQPPPLYLSASAVPATCGNANGSASSSVSGGTQPYSYLWTPGGSTSSFLSAVPAAPYSVSVTDSKGCIISASAAVSNFGGPTAAITSLSPVLCFGGNNGSASVAVAGGTAPFTYSWSPSGGTSPAASGLAAGNYTVTIHDGNNCSSSVSANIPQLPQLQVNTSSSNLSCFGSGNGNVSATASGGAGVYTYLWTPGGATSQSLSNLAAGTYQVTVSDHNNCTLSSTAIVSEPLILSASATTGNVSCFGGSNGTVTTFVSGGTGPYTYSWSPSVGSSPDATGLSAGTYVVTVTDANNCTRSVSATVAQPSSLLAQSSSSNVSCYGGSNGSASVIMSGGTSPFIYSWSPSGGNSNIANGLTAGTYTVNITDAHNCTQSSVVAIAQPPVLSSAIPASSNVSCYGGNNGSASAVASGGTTPYTYQWSPSGGTVSMATGLTAGNYIVTVIDLNNCIQSSNVSISQPAALIASPPVVTDVLCHGGNNGFASVAVAGGTSPYSYAWSPVGGNAASASGLTAGTYTVSITDANGCRVNAVSSINEPTALNLSAAAVPATCSGSNGSTSTSVSGGIAPYAFLWSPSGATSPSLPGIPAGAYSVTVTDAHGCTAGASAAVSNIGGPTASISALSPVSCFGGSNGAAAVSVTGGTAPFSYSWFPNGSTTATVSGIAAGNYTVTVIDGNYCVTSVPVSITQPPVLNAAASSLPVVCYGEANGSVSVSVSGGTSPYSYVWSFGSTTPVAANIASGNYLVTVTDYNGCSRTTSVAVSQPPVLAAAISGITNVLCSGGNNGAASVAVSGGTFPYTYLWTTTGCLAPAVSGLTAGNYSVTIRDANNCMQTAVVQILQPSALLSQSSSSNVSCYGGSNGSAAVTMSGGTSPFIYSWSPSGGNSNIANGLTAGTYTVNITDANNCTQSSVVAIAQPPVLSAAIPSSANVLCFGGNNGSATAVASGGTSPFTYQWFPSGGTGSIATALTAGNYSVTVIDANNCIQSSNVSILQPAVLMASPPVVTDVLCHGGNNGFASVAVAGGTSPYSYAWSPVGGNAASASGLSAGTYTVLIMDANGCQVNAVSSIMEPTALNLSAATIPATCSASNGAASTTVAGGVGPYAFLWSPSGATSPSLPGIPAGAYSVTVTDAHGCTVAASAPVSNIGGPTASISALSPVSCFGGSNGAAAVSVTGGTGPFSYSWFPNGGTTATVTGIAAGNYTVTVIDGNYCLTSVPVSITQPPVLNAAAASLPVVCYGEANGSVSVSASGGTSPYSYVWSFGNNAPSVSNIASGNYLVTVTDYNGCSRTSSVAVSQPQALAASISGITNILCAGGNNGAASVNVSGGTFPYTYLWTPTASIAPAVSGLTAGNYSVTIRDAHNCIQTAVADVLQPLALVLAPSASEVSCFGGNNGSASVSVTGGTTPYNYSWFPSGGNAAAASGLTSGNYTVHVTDDHGCNLSTAVLVDQPDMLNASIPVSSNVSCFNGNDGSATANVSGGIAPYTYAWTPSGGTGNIASGLSSGTYTITVADAHNCSQTSAIVIFQPLLLTTTIPASTGVSCYNGNNGTASAIVNGGTSPYLFAWTPSGGNAPLASGLVAGNYSVSVTDAHGCIAANSVTVNQPDSIILNTNTSPVTCNAFSNGSAFATVASGGTGPFQYNWSPSGGNNNTATNLFSGTYTVTINDHNGCIASATVSVNQPTAVVLNTSSTDVLCFGGHNGTSGVVAAGGTLPYSYSWSPVGGTDTLAVNLIAGTYHVDVTDGNGCLSSSSVTVNQPPVLNVNVQGAVTICIGQSASIAASASGGVGNYIYQWNNGVNAVSQTISPVTTSSYSVLVIDGNGCTVASSPLLINVNPPLLAAATGANPICVGDQTNVSANGTGGNGGPFNYIWNNGMSGQTIHVAPVVTTTYIVRVSDGCTTPDVFDSTTVVVNQLPQVNFVPHPLTGCEPLLAHFLDGTTTSPGSTYMWNFGDGTHSTQQEPVHLYNHSGTYSVSLTVMSHEGCVGGLTVQNAVVVYPLPTALFITDPDQTTILNPTISFTDQSIEAAQWDWDFGDGLGRSSTQNNRYTYQDTGAFVIRLIATSDKGCIDTTYGRIVVEGDFIMYIPNAFTPNYDGVNDGFVASGIGVKDFDMYIFDRWGLQIFHSTSMYQPWDGKVQGSEKTCQIDVYVYKIIARDVRERMHEYIGHLSLVR